MKKKHVHIIGFDSNGKVLCVITLFFVFLFLPFEVYCNDYSVTFKKNKTNRALTFNTSSEDVLFGVRITEEKDGILSPKVPPSFIFSLKNGIVLGELKMSSYAAFALNPFSSSVFNLSKQKGIKENPSLSFSPVFSGIAKNLTLKNKMHSVTFAAFNPVLNPLSPLGFLVMYNGPALFATLIKLTGNNINRKNIKEEYQTQWREVNFYTERYYLLLGLKGDFEISALKTKTFVFTERIIDGALGEWGSSGFNVNLNLKPYTMEVYTRNNSSGVLREKEKETAIEFYIEKGVNLFVFYSVEQYPFPLYGGKSRKEVYTYRVMAEYEKFSLDAKHSYTIEEDTGHSTESVYIFNAGRFKVLNNNVNFRASIDLIRTKGVDLTFKKFSLRVQDNIAKAEVSGEKFLLTLSYETYINRVKFNFSVTQDRVFSVSARYSF